ncbi:uncharacterized protein [Panulirus ornatus]|uniref:uncharacterized protein isoform X2 n=1 Tax=Panulirus ornatus TaxID=150431 RepID=UPI003A85D9E5
MSDSGIGNSPGRQRRSTERSRENIREYVKLLGKKVTDSSSGQKSPRSTKEGKSPVDAASSKLRSDEDVLEGNPSPIQISPLEKVDVSVKEVVKKGCMSPRKSPKAKRKLETEETISPFYQDLASYYTVKNEIYDDSDVEIQSVDMREKMDLGQKSQVSLKVTEISSSDRDGKEESKQNNPLLNDDKTVQWSSSRNKDLMESFCGFDLKEVHAQHGGEETSTSTSLNNSSKKYTPKAEKAESTSDSPPDLILFLKEGRGRAQIWTEPPTLNPESIATRRRTRVPEDPKSLALSKGKTLMHDRLKKDGKEVPKKDGRKERKLKVLDTPESLKRLAQDYPIKDSSKLSNTSKQEVLENVNETKGAKKINSKNVLEHANKEKINDKLVSTDDGIQSNVVKRPKGKKKTTCDLASAPVLDASKSNLVVLQTMKEAQSKKSDYLNLENILHQMTENKADSRIPVVIMSDSDKDNRIDRAMPKSKKKSQSEVKASKAVLKMAMPLKLTSSDIKLSEEHLSMDDRFSFISDERKNHKTLTQELKVKEQNSLGNDNEDIRINTVTSLSSYTQSKKDDSYSFRKHKQSVLNSQGGFLNERSQDNANTSNDINSVSKSQDSKKLSLMNEVAINYPVLKPVNSSSKGANNLIPSSVLQPASLKSTGTQNSQKPPLLVSVADFLSLKVTAVNPRNSNASPRKLNLKIPSIKGVTGDVILKNATGFGKETVIIKSGVINSSPKPVIIADERSQTSTNQQSSLYPQKVHLYDYTDIETEEVVVGETEDISGQMLSVGELSAEVDLIANEELESSSEDDSTKVPELHPIIKRDMLSPEGRVALDHSYSSGSIEKTKTSNNTRKKSPVSYEKSLTPRPVYSSASLAKRSLDIMLHNDKINILRQMSQIFNHEKPVQPDTDNTVSSSEGEGEEDTKDNLNDTGIIEQNKIVKETGVSRDRKIDKKNSCSGDVSSEASHVNEVLKTASNSEAVRIHLTEQVTGSSSLHTSDDVYPSGVTMDSNVDSIKEDSALANCSSKAFINTCLGIIKSNQTNNPNVDNISHLKDSKNMNKTGVNIAVNTDSPFLGFPDPEPKVHHVPAYSVALDEMIQVQSTVGPGGELVDIVDGFSFISFSTKEEMIAYTNKQNSRGEKGHRPWLKKKRKKRKKLIKNKMHSGLGQNQLSNLHEKNPHISKEGCSNDSGAFASNDLDAYLNHNSHLNISYTIPKCKATEEGVTRIDEDDMLQDRKPLEIPPQVPEPILMESQTVDAVDPNNQQAPSSAEIVSDSVQHYEEVSALDILYPKEKYKYYYNKDLCKETKADGSNVFVRRGGKLVPLTSVFKSHKASVVESSSKKTVELVYIYDRGKLLTLGGSLTKINPSNSDSVRARVILPIGIPPILKGDIVRSRAKKVQAVEINEDMAKFALSALQNPNPKEEQLIEINDENESKPVPELCISSGQENTEKPECEGDLEEKEQSVNASENVSVVPTKRNILDIIAAKLAMSDGESDEKDDGEENKSDADEKTESIFQGSVTDQKCEDEDTKENVKKENLKGNPVKEEDKEKDMETENKATEKCITEEKPDMKEEDKVKRIELKNEMIATSLTGVKPDMKEEELARESPVKAHKDPEGNIDKKSKLETENKDVTVLKNDEKVIDIKDEAQEVKEDEESGGKKSNSDTMEEDKMCNKSVITDVKDQTKTSAENIKDSQETDSVEAQEQNNYKKSKDELGNTCCNTDTDSLANHISNENGELFHEQAEEDNAEEKRLSALPEMMESETSMDKISQKADGKSRVFKKNMHRFPSLSREMKRLNMNFVKYVPQESTAEDTMAKEVEVKQNCDNEHCRLGCVCDSLTCRRRSMEHCGRVECMFECTCRDESWKHCVSGTGRTMNAVSIFNLDREQNEGLALREKDFRRTVIQTSSEVILVGAERKKRERRIPGRYRDSAMWTGTDFVAVDNTSTCEPETNILPEFPSIPLSEASKYIKRFKLNVPWYDIKGISIWCMNHSCYDCKCLLDPTFYDSHKEVSPEKKERFSRSDSNTKIPSALDTFEEALREKRNCGLVSSSKNIEFEDRNTSGESCCSVVNIIVNNTEARRKYSWKLKEWYHPTETHCARTSGYSKQCIFEETKHMTISGPTARETTPEQMVETVVKSLRHEKEKINVPTNPSGGKLESSSGDSLTGLPTVLGSASDSDELHAGKAKTVCGTVPLVDLTSSSYSDDVDLDSLTSLAKTQKHIVSKNMKTYLSSKDVKGPVKRKLSGVYDKPAPKLGYDASQSTKKSRQSSMQEDILPWNDSLSPNSLPLSVESLFPEESKISTTSLSSVNNEKESGRAANSEKRLCRKPLSLLEMMLAEEKRGELELDLSNNFPGNALLVAEARFRKLINMNIIGVIGINKAGRCIIDTVDSIESLRVMQRIHNMISNSTLDVGPNMREIFFPPPYIGTRPRFVMIRCDLNNKWEIVGVVQKKGPVKTSKYPEQKTKVGTVQKVSSIAPQVIDLEEEEKQKEQPKEDRPDVVILPSEDEVPGLADAASQERDSGAWEGSLPLIASVHSASDSNMAEFIGSPERVCDDSVVTIPSFENSSSLTRKTSSSSKAIPDLVPISTCSLDELDTEVTQRKEALKTEDIVPVSGVRSELQQLYCGSSAFSTVTKTSGSVSALVTSNVGMKAIKLNPSSSRVFGDSSVETSLTLMSPSLTASLSTGSSSQPVMSRSCTSGKLNITSPIVTSDSTTRDVSRPVSSTSFKEEFDNIPVPASTGSVDELHSEISQRKDFMKTQSVSKSGVRSELQQQLNCGPAAFSTLTKTTTTLSAVITSTPGMKTFKLNPSSARVFSDSTGENSLPLVSQTLATTTFSPKTSSQPLMSGPGTSGKLAILPPKITPESPAFVLSIPESGVSVKEESSNNIPKINECPGQNRRVISPAMPGNTALRTSTQTAAEEGNNTIVNQNLSVSSAPNSKMLYIPVSSGCVSKMIFMPTVSGGSSPRMMLLPTIHGSNGGLDTSKMKMFLVPSSQDSNKMIFFPASAETSDAHATNVAVTSGPSENEKKMLVVPSSMLGNLGNIITRPPPFVEQKSKLLVPRPTVINDSPSFASPCTGTLLVPLKNAGTLPSKSCTDEISSLGKTETNNASQETEKDTTVQDDSDDVVVIGPATNSLTITRVRTASESTFSRAESNSSRSCTSPSLLIMPAPPVSSGGKAETNVVSSVITISSTISSKTQSPQKDCDTVFASDITKSSTLNSANSPGDAVIVKTSLNAMQLNALLQSTHRDMLKSGDTWSSGAHSKALESKVALRDGEESSLPEAKLIKISCKLPAQNESRVVEHERKGIEEVEEVGSKCVPIKKGGYHWSAVDLSLNFKSVKLEWLLGTIRKNVLMNIYRMSLKTQSPVTLSVKNGSSTSMLYGLARRGYVYRDGDHPLPVLILGSVVSAVMSSSTTPDAMLFQVNAIKYFIRESTGELSSYTYDMTGDFLVKLASKKRGDGGEMIGIGEKVPIQKMREISYTAENSSHRTSSGKTDTGSANEKCCPPALKSKMQDGNGCSCTVAGDFICLGHSAPQWKEKESIESSACNQSVTRRSQPLPLDHSCTIHQESTQTTSSFSETLLLQDLSVTKESKAKASDTLSPFVKCSSVPGSVVCDTSQSDKPQVKESLQDSSHVDPEKIRTNSDLISQVSPIISKDFQCSKLDLQSKSEEVSSVPSSELSSTEKSTPVVLKSVSNSEVKILSSSESCPIPKVDAPDKLQKPGSPSNRKGLEGRDIEKEVEDFVSESSEVAQGLNIQDEIEDVDIVGDYDTNLPVSTFFRKQMMNDAFPDKKVTQSATPGDVAKRLLALPSVAAEAKYKRKIDDVYPEFERPCPRSKKRLLKTGDDRAHFHEKSMNEPPEIEVYELQSAKSSKYPSSESSSRCPSHLAHLRPFAQGELSAISEEEAKPGPSGIKIPKKPKFNIVPGKNNKERLGKNVVRDVKFVDVEGNPEERSSFVHNELERMRRRIMRHLFANLQNSIAKVPSSRVLAEGSALPKITILSAGSRICEILKQEDAELWAEKERVMERRDSLIKKLVSVIAGAPEDLRLRWREWIQIHMKDPTAKQEFERKWKPVELEKEVMNFSSSESSFDMDMDDGSPLPGPASPHSFTDGPTPPITSLKEGQASKQKLKNVDKAIVKGKKKLGRPQKLVLDSRYQGMNITSEAATVIPTSILLMAGTSSRGRKIVRKEDTNFVTS